MPSTPTCDETRVARSQVEVEVEIYLLLNYSSTRLLSLDYPSTTPSPTLAELTLGHVKVAAHITATDNMLKRQSIRARARRIPGEARGCCETIGRFWHLRWGAGALRRWHCRQRTWRGEFSSLVELHLPCPSATLVAVMVVAAVRGNPGERMCEWESGSKGGEKVESGRY